MHQGVTYSVADMTTAALWYQAHRQLQLLDAGMLFGDSYKQCRTHVRLVEQLFTELRRRGEQLSLLP